MSTQFLLSFSFCYFSTNLNKTKMRIVANWNFYTYILCFMFYFLYQLKVLAIFLVFLLAFAFKKHI